MKKMDTPVRDVLAGREMALGPQGKADKSLKHWRLSIDGDKVAWLILDRQGESANTLSGEVLEELDKMLAAVDGKGPRGLVIRSAKKAGFVAGADIREFRDLGQPDEASKQLKRAHVVIDRLDRLDVPTIAVIHGHCLGGGLELALACDYRLAVDGAKLGFPEVMLGLHPGLGGTFRLTGLIDPIEAMTMMLTGKSAHAKKAKKLGLVDAVIEERHVDNAVRAVLAGKVDEAGGTWSGTAFSLKPARAVAARRMRAKTAERAKEEHYPAPFRMIDLWEDHGGDPKAMQEAEIASFSRLLAGRTSQNLVRAFFLREKLRANGKVKADIGHVHVIGAGAMGGDIAAWCARQGLTATLTDLDPKAIAKAIGRASELFEKSLHSGIERRDAFDRLVPDFAGAGVAKADVVIEAVAEKTDVKHTVLKDIAARARKDALIATNTSSIPLEALAKALPDASRLVGLHFFNPVNRMELVEVVAHDKAAKKMLDKANAFCGTISRLPAPVKSAPGFLVNRALTPYLVEAFMLMEEGVSKETIDRAAEDFGMPMGPIELADRVGLDICLSVATMLKEELNEPMPEIPSWLKEKVDKGELGKKTGKGLYDYDSNGKPKKANHTKSADAETVDRLVLPMVNTCMGCLRKGVVADEDTLDAAMIFGTGFAPFRGGPMRYATERGHADIVKSLSRLAEKHGDRFAPDPGWNVETAQQAA
jgi:3-hydroxyacyl-CoA dehydrogenase / enoyl-CoA hydratase / 3-hydroxybutyryl-CoA epimerase